MPASCPRPCSAVRLLLGCLALLSAGCTDVRLQPAGEEGPPRLDDELTLAGSFCTDVPLEESFPVKILFVIDTSGSMQFTDPSQQRALAVQDVVDRFAGVPGIEVGIIAFNGRVRNPTEGFTADQGALQQAIGTALREADSVTDYQGALAMAHGVLLEDMRRAAERSGTAELARSKYVVVFFSDGTPQPQCSASGPDPFLVCDFDKGSVNVPEDVFPELEAGRDYNQPYQIYDKVEQIMGLKAVFHVGDLRLHTALLYDEEEAEIAREVFGLDLEEGRKLLREMADIGQGSFLSFYDGEEINFLSLDYTRIKRPYVVKSFLVTNASAVATGGQAGPDSDGDGLSDAREFTLGTDPARVDTDGDGYGDLLESNLARRGFDPLLPEAPVVPCGQRGGPLDSDQDGLSNCEEAVLGTERLHPDSDADGLPDGVEHVAGLDPTDPDDLGGDADLDGRRNGEEVLVHLDPSQHDRAGGAQAEPERDHYRYRLEEALRTFDGRTCYRFEVRHVRLLTPLARGPEELGWNTLRVWLGQTPQDQPGDRGVFRTGCLRAKFVPPDLKEPLSGYWDLDPGGRFPEAEPGQPSGGDGERSWLVPSADFDPELDCRRP